MNPQRLHGEQVTLAMRMRHKTVGKEGENLREAFSVRVPEDVFSPHRMLALGTIHLLFSLQRTVPKK